jgi:NTP pyrophosphatase (non-canonical NTP hydrolase)
MIRESHVPGHLAARIIAFWNLTGRKYPDVDQGLRFLAEELGEACRAWNNISEPGWVRNHPEDNRQTMNDFLDELGDIALMAIVTSFAVSIPDDNALAYMLEKIDRKSREIRAESSASCPSIPPLADCWPMSAIHQDSATDEVCDVCSRQEQVADEHENAESCGTCGGSGRVTLFVRCGECERRNNDRSVILDNADREYLRSLGIDPDAMEEDSGEHLPSYIIVQQGEENNETETACSLCHYYPPIHPEDHCSKYRLPGTKCSMFISK